MKLLRRLNVPASVLSSLETSAPLAVPTPSEAVVDEGTTAHAPSASLVAGNFKPTAQPPVVAGTGHPWRIVWALVGLGLLGAGLVNFMWPAGSQEPASTSPPVLIDKPDAAGPSVPAPAAVSPVADESDRADLAEPVVLPQGSRCALDANVRVISPDRPSKPADYVYLMASRQVTVCIQDADGRQTRVTLQAGRNVNIPGRPPFDLTADTWTHLQVFFQGQRMALPVGMPGVRLQAQDTRR